jgi:putative sterol carrier protein
MKGSSMSDVVTAAVAALSEKLGDDSFDASAKFAIDGEGSLIVDSDGVRAGDDETDVTLSADTETFQAILEGTLNPTNAFMSGKLRVEGDMSVAMRLAGVLA